MTGIMQRTKRAYRVVKAAVARHPKRFKAALKAGQYVTRRALAPSNDKVNHHARKARGATEQAVAEHGVIERNAVINVGHHKRDPKKLKKGLWRYTQTQSGLNYCPAGVQLVTDMFHVGTSYQSVKHSGAGYLTYQAYDALIELNPYDYISGSGLFGAGTVPAAGKFMLLENAVTIEITNTSVCAVIADMYVLECKKDALFSLPPSNAWANGYVDAGLGVAQEIPPAAGLSTGTAGTESLSQVGSLPKQSRQFGNYYKTLKVEHFDLAPGSTHVMKFILKHDKVQDQEYLAQSVSNTVTFIHGQSVSFMLVQRGQVTLDVTGGVKLPTFGSNELAWIATTKTVACCIKGGNAERLNVNEAVSRIPTSSLESNQKLINVVDVPSTNSVL